MVMGMTPTEFWDGVPDLVKTYRQYHKLKQEQENNGYWLQGLYTYQALCTALGNAFRGKGEQPKNYPDKPINISGEIDEEIERRKVINQLESLRLLNGNDSGRKS